MENNQTLIKLLKDYYEVNSFIQRFDEDEIDARDLKVLINKLKSGLAEEITDKEGINKRVMFRLTDDMLVFNLKTVDGNMVAVFSEDESKGITEFLKILLQSISLEISTSSEPHYCDVDYYYEDEDEDEEYDDDYDHGYGEGYDEDEEVKDNRDVTVPLDFLTELIDYIQELND